MSKSLSLIEEGAFVIGCNYWASHAGTAMWSDWRPEVVEADLQQLAAAGLQVLRVFPLWPDFQPLSLLTNGHAGEFRHGEQPLPDTEAGRAGMSAEMMQRFAAFADLAEAHGLKLVIGLITGWMSGRLFVPPALEGRNPITDPMSILWQVRMAKHFVQQFRQHPAILAWDLGNECNCMGAATREQAWLWTNTLVDAIRTQDPSRPIVSGMHSLQADPLKPWAIADQGELTDVLTTHPYPIFTPHCDAEPIRRIRPCLHSAAESRLYADLGGRPCLIEEIGTLGPMIASPRASAEYLRSVLFSGWANDCHGLLWWCAYDQGHLEHAPYDWNGVERELGLFTADRQAKPAADVLSAFGRWLSQLPIDRLPPRVVDAVCVLTRNQDHWAAALGAFILAKQAGMDIAFQYADQPLRDAQLYLVPSIRSDRGLRRREWLALLDRVQRGATLYVSCDDGIVSPFTEVFGLEVEGRSRRTGPCQINLDVLQGSPRLAIPSALRLDLALVGAEALGREADGNPAFTCAAYGDGQAYFLTAPIETDMAYSAGSFESPASRDAWRIYEHLAGPVTQYSRAAAKGHPLLGMTEHVLGDAWRVVVLVNYSPQEVSDTLQLGDDWVIDEVWYGQPLPGGRGEVSCRLAANDALVLSVRKK